MESATDNKHGETNLNILLASMQPVLNPGDYVFCQADDPGRIDMQRVVCSFREKEGLTLILERDYADQLKLHYSFVAAWITLMIHSSLEATGLTAAFSRALADEHISCNVVAAYYHDHIFVAKKDAVRAMDLLLDLSRKKSIQQ